MKPGWAEALRVWGEWLYWQCTDFMINAAGLLGVTYRDTNSGMFFVLWPAVTLVLVVAVVWQAGVIWRLRRRRENSG